MGVVLRNSIPAKIGFVALAAGLVFLGLTASREMLKKKQAEEAIEKLQAEADKIRNDNAAIQEKISYLESRDFREREAKDKLNLQNPGENVIIIKPEIAKPPAPEEINSESQPSGGQKIPIYHKWWLYFFE